MAAEDNSSHWNGPRLGVQGRAQPIIEEGAGSGPLSYSGGGQTRSRASRLGEPRRMARLETLGIFEGSPRDRHSKALERNES
jgi:hypothetical protein